MDFPLNPAKTSMGPLAAVNGFQVISGCSVKAAISMPIGGSAMTGGNIAPSRAIGGDWRRERQPKPDNKPINPIATLPINQRLTEQWPSILLQSASINRRMFW